MSHYLFVSASDLLQRGNYNLRRCVFIILVFHIMMALTFSSLKVLSALDVHTSKWVLEKCFLGDLARGRTIIMVVCVFLCVSLRLLLSTITLQTHNVSMVGPRADFVVSLGSDGRVLARGSFSEVLSRNTKLRRAVSDNLKQVEKANQEVDGDNMDEVEDASDGKLVVEEESGIGHLSWASREFILLEHGTI